ncbi:MAG: hypothetical protein AMS24_00775 [Chlamydiae bacterium SM23_39]|nr:MAG: hypothetical protein AMS24_00775 [Chlamydiae bacterium SM23_39]
MRKKEIKTIPYQKALINMEKKLSKSFKNLSRDMLKSSEIKIIQKDVHELMILLGEANYLAKECKKIKKIK